MSRFINSDKVLSSLGKRSVTSGHHIQCNDSLDTPAVLVSVSETCLHLERKSHQLVKHHNFSFLHIHVADCTTISDTLHMYVLLQGNQLAPFRVTQQNDLVQFANMFTHVPCAWNDLEIYMYLPNVQAKFPPKFALKILHPYVQCITT